MHGLVNRSIQCFLRDTYGVTTWNAVAREAGLGFDSFEPMLTYDPALTEAVIVAAGKTLNRARDSVLEDLGTYLVSHPNAEALRRLLRFGGVNFEDFLLSLEDLPERGRMALPDLDLPAFDLTDAGGGVFGLTVSAPIAGTGHVIVGLLRAMADEYGALVLLDHESGVKAGDDVWCERIAIQLLDDAYAKGRSFALSSLSGA
jgi:hypothetical protein